MSKATQIERIEQDGYEGTVYQNNEKGTQFVSWHLGTFSAEHGGAVKVTGVTARNGSPKAAAYNLANSRSFFLERALRSRCQWRREAGSIVVSVPGAQVQGVGYEGPLALKLEERLANTDDLGLALSVMAKAITTVTARGVYAQYSQTQAAESEGDVENIEF